MPRRIPITISRILAVILGLALTGFVAYLVFAQYRSQAALRTTTILQLSNDTEKRATALTYFFGEVIDDIQNLADSPEMTAYFENVALGMSMEYGLRASLQAINEHIDTVRLKKKLGERQLFERISFIDPTGKILVDSRTRPGKNAKTQDYGQLKRYARKIGAPAYQIDREHVDPRVILSVPIHFNDEYKGQLLASFPVSVVYEYFVAQNSGSQNYPTALAYRGTYLSLPATVKGLLPEGAASLPIDIQPGEPYLLRHTKSSALGKDVRATMLPVGATGFSLVTYIPGTDQFSAMSPLLILMTTAGIALFMIFGMFFFVRTDLRHSILKAHLEETSLREQIIGEKNRELESEIAERRRNEREVSRLNGELEERVRNRTADLEASNREQEGFCYTISHDLRAPLARIEGFCDAVHEDCCKQFDSLCSGYIERIRAVCSQLQQSIDGLLDMNNLSRREVVFADIDLSNIVRQLADDLCKASPQRSVTFNIAPKAPARCDERLVNLLLENLVDNAWKFTQKTPAARIDFGITVLPGHKAMFYVRDNGAGFEMAYAHKLFQPFQRLHNQQDFSGIGIGLASAARIVQRHGGAIWAEAEPGKGAAFYFTLPETEENGGDNR